MGDGVRGRAAGAAWAVGAAAVLAAGLAAPTQAQSTVRVNLGPGGVQSDGFSTRVGISQDGRHVVFVNLGTNLVPPLMPTGRQVYASDRDPDQNGVLDDTPPVVTLMSIGIDGLPGNGSQGGFNGQFGVDCSDDGRFVVWSSQSTNLVPNDNTGFGTYDVIVRDRDPDQNGVFDEGNGVNVRATLSVAGGDPSSPDNGGDQIGISGDGRYVVFSSSSRNLVVGDDLTRIGPGIYLRDLQLNITSLIVQTGINTGSRYPHISADGAWVVFNTFRGDMPPINIRDIVVRPRSGVGGVTVSKDDNGVLGDANSGGDPNTTGPRISGDGRFVVFRSIATNLDITRPGEQPGVWKLYLHDRDTDADGVFDEPGAFSTRRIDVSPAGDPANGFVSNPDIDDAGTAVWFLTNATNLDPADTLAGFDIVRYDIATGAISIASLSDTGMQVAGNSDTGPAVSGDGAHAAFTSGAPALVPGDTNGRTDVFVRTTGTVCTADFNQSGAVDVFDILDYLTAWNATDPAADLDGDGSFTIFDVLDFLAQWSAGCP